MIRLVLRSAAVVILFAPSLVRAVEAPPDASDAIVDRTIEEATDVLRLVVRDRVKRTEPCTIDDNWATTPVSASSARKYLGSTLYADLHAPYIGKSPIDIIDQGSVEKNLICSEAESDQMWLQRSSDFRTNLVPGRIERFPRNPSISRTRTSITMPVFDKTYSTAIVIVGYMTKTLIKTSEEEAGLYPKKYDPEGYSRHATLEGAGLLLVYRKQAEGWREIAAEEAWSAN